MKRMANRVSLVTGGGSGIGQAVAVLLAQEGSKVIVVGRRQKPLSTTVAQIHAIGEDAILACGDVSLLGNVRKVIDIALDRYERIDTLINCAGIVRRFEEVEDTTEEQWNRQFDVNLKGVFNTTKLVLPLMKAQEFGVIVNIGSTLATLAASGYATYCATKGGVLAFTRAIALQYARYGIRANVVSPGMVETPMLYVDRPDFADKIDDIVAQDYPLQRIGSPLDVAQAVLFLASNEASWITGQNLLVDGGYSIK